MPKSHHEAMELTDTSSDADELGLTFPSTNTTYPTGSAQIVFLQGTGFCIFGLDNTLLLSESRLTFDEENATYPSDKATLSYVTDVGFVGYANSGTFILDSASSFFEKLEVGQPSTTGGTSALILGQKDIDQPVFSLNVVHGAGTSSVSTNAEQTATGGSGYLYCDMLGTPFFLQGFWAW